MEDYVLDCFVSSEENEFNWDKENKNGRSETVKVKRLCLDDLPIAPESGPQIKFESKYHAPWIKDHKNKSLFDQFNNINYVPPVKVKSTRGKGGLSSYDDVIPSEQNKSYASFVPGPILKPYSNVLSDLEEVSDEELDEDEPNQFNVNSDEIFEKSEFKDTVLEFSDISDNEFEVDDDDDDKNINVILDLDKYPKTVTNYKVGLHSTASIMSKIDKMKRTTPNLKRKYPYWEDNNLLPDKSFVTQRLPSLFDPLILKKEERKCENCGGNHHFNQCPNMPIAKTDYHSVNGRKYCWHCQPLAFHMSWDCPRKIQ